MAATKAISFALLLFILQLHFHGTAADYGGWQSAHATFYGGGDASGTMGMSQPLANSIILLSFWKKMFDICVLQEVHVDMGTYIVRVMEPTLQL